MASNLIINFQTKADNTGSDQIGKGMEGMKRQMKESASAADGVAKSFSTLKNIIASTLLTLPLTGFVKDAIASEEVTARFGIQLKSLGQDINTLDIEGLTQRLHQFGITQTEVITALSRGLPYFKSTANELKYLDTAIGMTRYSGVELSTAFQQLGYILEYGNARVARQYGVSMHSEIHEPTQRAAAVVGDLQKAMEPLATATGTTAEKMKAMSAIIKDTGEKIGAEFLGPIAATAEAFNKLSPEMQTMIIRTVLLASAIAGLALAFNTLKTAMAGTAILGTITGLKELLAVPFISNAGKLQMAIAGLAGSLGTLAVVGAGLAAFVLLKNEISKTEEAIKNASKTEMEYHQMLREAYRARASDATAAIGEEEKFADKLKETQKILRNLYTQQGLFRQQGRKDAEERAKAEANTVKIFLEGQQQEYDSLVKHNISTLDQYQKFQYKMAELRVAAMKEGNDKDLAEFNLRMLKEKDVMTKQYGDEMDVRLALAKAEAQAETEIFKKAVSKELEYALMTKEERKNYDKDYETAKRKLSNLTVENFKESDDSLKALVKTAGGQKALEEQTTAWAEQRTQIAETRKELDLYYATAAEIANLYQQNSDKNIETLKKEEEAIINRKRAELERGAAGMESLKYFASEEKTVNTKADFKINTTVNITPNLSEIGDAAANAVKKAVDSNAKKIEDNVKTRITEWQ